jgi:hypothetical protein
MNSEHNSELYSEENCLKCQNKEHTIAEHKKLKRREYMREYMYKYKEGKVAYRRWEFVPKTEL